MDLKKTASIDTEEKYLDILDVYNDKSFLYGVLTSESARYYNNLKYGFAIPIIISSSVLSIINGGSIFSDDDKNLKLVNTVVNISTALLISISNSLKFETKANAFHSISIKFQKLSHEIESKVLEGTINNTEFISSITSQYDNIVESTPDIPSRICRKIRSEYATKKHLPTCINGIKKESPSSSVSTPKLSPIKRLSVSLVSNFV